MTDVNEMEIELVCAPSNRDGRDWQLPIKSIKKTATVDVNTFSRRLLTPNVVHQGSIGSCVGQSGRVVISDTEQNGNLDLSPMWIYKKAKKYDYWKGEDYEGTSISGACKALVKEGVCLESLWPYVPTEETHPELGAAEDAASRKIKSYYYVSVRDHKAIKNLLIKESLWVSLTLTDAFRGIRVDDDGMITPLDSDKAIGGHAVAIVGWTHINGELFWEIQNSWGTRWGDNGYCFISAKLLTHLSSSGAYSLVMNDEEHEERAIARRTPREMLRRVFNQWKTAAEDLYRWIKTKVLRRR